MKGNFYGDGLEFHKDRRSRWVLPESVRSSKQRSLEIIVLYIFFGFKLLLFNVSFIVVQCVLMVYSRFR